MDCSGPFWCEMLQDFTCSRPSSSFAICFAHAADHQTCIDAQSYAVRYAVGVSLQIAFGGRRIGQNVSELTS
jgi:hypothetical protein